MIIYNQTVKHYETVVFFFQESGVGSLIRRIGSKNRPLISRNIALQNEEFDYPVHVFAHNETSIGNNVNIDVNPGPVVVNNRGRLMIKSKKGTTLDKGFSVELGGTLEIEN